MLNITGIAGNTQLVTVPYKDLAIVISPVLKIPVFNKENAFAHERVIRELMQKYTTLPVSFGTIATSIQELKEYLIVNYPQLKMLLAKVIGKIEVGLKVFWNKEKFAQELEEGRGDVLNLKNIINNKDTKESYQLVLKLGQLLEAIAEEKREIYKEQIFEPLASFSSDAVLNDLIGERMVFNASFLIEKTKEKEFDKKVNEIYEPFRQILDFKYTGPWPPYNFTKTVFHKK